MSHKFRYHFNAYAPNTTQAHGHVKIMGMRAQKMTENVNIGNLQDFWQFFYPLCPCSTHKFHMHHVKISKELSSEMRQEWFYPLNMSGLFLQIYLKPSVDYLKWLDTTCCLDMPVKNRKYSLSIQGDSPWPRDPWGKVDQQRFRAICNFAIIMH